MISIANSDDHATLTRVAFSAKSHWGYPKEYFRIWQPELTVTPDYLTANSVFTYEDRGVIVAWYSLVELENDTEHGPVKLDAGLWLDHMWVLPDHIGEGIGRLLFEHIVVQMTDLGYVRLRVLADPFARGFYEKMGCSHVDDYASTIEGRTIPLMVFERGAEK